MCVYVKACRRERRDGSERQEATASISEATKALRRKGVWELEQ